MVEAAPNNSIKAAPLADPNDRAQTEFTWAPTCWPGWQMRIENRIKQNKQSLDCSQQTMRSLDAQARSGGA